VNSGGYSPLKIMYGKLVLPSIEPEAYAVCVCALAILVVKYLNLSGFD